MRSVLKLRVACFCRRYMQTILLKEAISLIDKAIVNQGQPASWADLGCGSGMFTGALSALLEDGSNIFAIDQLPHNPQIHSAKNTVTIEYIAANFEKELLSLNLLDGILMANSLHYVSDKKLLLTKLKTYLQPHATFIIVEYDTSHANQWVPYPINKQQLRKLFIEAGFGNCQILGERPSLYGKGNMYACQFSQG